MLKLTDRQKDILRVEGHALVKGGPGSGKTTVSILKAGKVVSDGLRPPRRVLFLSFARATVSRVLEAIDETGELSPETRRQIEVDTYHAFFWRLIRSHGYLLGLPRRLNVLTPHSEAVALSDIRSEYGPADKLGQAERCEKQRREEERLLCIAVEDGRVCFDLFAEFAGQLLHGSEKIQLLVANAYPMIVLDEFQDTADGQWNVIRALGRDSRLLALADPEQRIFDFIGAHPERLRHFQDEFAVSVFDLSDENHRSKGTDIARFGNDILRGRFSRSSYDGVRCRVFEANKNQALTRLVLETLQARKRLLENGGKNWSLAVLVPTKRMTRLVSDFFRSPIGKLPRVEHFAAVDVGAAILAAEVIAHALQSTGSHVDMNEFVELICRYFRGKGGETPAKSNLEEASRIERAYETARVRRKSGKEPSRNSLFLTMEAACQAVVGLQLAGDPARDWVAIRTHFADCACRRMQEIADEVRNIRLLDRGAQLRDSLSQNWRENGHYSRAQEIVRQAFVQEHFSTNTKPESGVVVMNMHKAKGKQFDEVIIFEGWPRYRKGKIIGNPDRIVRGNLKANADEQTRQNLMVSVTRARKRTTLLTPTVDRCVLLVPET